MNNNDEKVDYKAESDHEQGIEIHDSSKSQLKKLLADQKMELKKFLKQQKEERKKFLKEVIGEARLISDRQKQESLKHHDKLLTNSQEEDIEENDEKKETKVSL